MMNGVAIRNYGSMNEMNIEQFPLPVVGDMDVLLEVHAAAVNPVDIAIRNGWLKERINFHFPLILGWDVSGVVKEVGANVTKYKVGDEVYSYPDLSRNGSYAEFISVDERLIALKPKNISFEEAASLPLVGTCAYRSLIDIGKIEKGQKLLVLGGSGGVGSFAIQLAKSVGVYVVATTSTKNVDFVKSLGADEVIDYTTTEISTYNGNFDIVFDTVGRTPFEQSFNLIKSGGIIVSVATFPTEENKKVAMEKGFTIEFLISDPNGDILKKITSFVEEEKIKPVVQTILPLNEVQKAHELSESNRTKGKIVLQIKN